LNFTGKSFQAITCT